MKYCKAWHTPWQLLDYSYSAPVGRLGDPEESGYSTGMSVWLGLLSCSGVALPFSTNSRVC